MDFNEFYKKYDFSDNLFHRIAGISGECVKAMREGKNVRPKTRKRIEAVSNALLTTICIFQESFLEEKLDGCAVMIV